MLHRVLSSLWTGAFLVGFFALALAIHAWAAEGDYRANLGPMPLNDETQLVIAGRGEAIARLEADTLTVSGTFEGLNSPATEAHLCQSMWTGVPGRKIFDLTVSKDVSGKVAGKLKLDTDQLAAFKSGKLYVQINSEKAPDGNLWGWLLLGHERVGQDVPQKGPWFLPKPMVRTK